MQQSKWADRFFMIGFLGFLALALSITLMQPKTSWSYYENRTLAQPAELSVETVLDGTFPSSVEPALQDHAAGRNTLMQLSAWTDLHLFHRPVVNQVVPADGMLLGWNPYETPNPAAITAQAEHMAEELARLRDVSRGVWRLLLLYSSPRAIRLLFRVLSRLSQQPGGIYCPGGPRPYSGHGEAWDGPSGHGSGAGHSWQPHRILLHS